MQNKILSMKSDRIQIPNFRTLIQVHTLRMNTQMHIIPFSNFDKFNFTDTMK